MEFDYEFIDRRSCAGYNIGKRTGYIEYFDKDLSLMIRVYALVVIKDQPEHPDPVFYVKLYQATSDTNFKNLYEVTRG